MRLNVLAQMIHSQSIVVVLLHGLRIDLECQQELAVWVPLQLLESLHFLVIDQRRNL